MSFELTPFEQSRVEIASYLDLKLDPISHVDMSTIIVVSTVYALELFAIIFMVVNRNYPPIKAKCVPVVASLYVAILFWFVGDISTGGLVHLYPSHALRACKVTAIWFRLGLGPTFIAGIFSARSYILYRIFCQKDPFQGRLVWACFALAVGWMLLYATISSLLPERMTTFYDDTMDICYVNKTFAAISIGMICCFYLFVLWMTWQLRKVPFSFNEFREISTSMVILLIVIVFNSVAIFSVKAYPLSAAWRNSLVYINHTCANIVFWIILWEPLYQCFMHRDEYLQYWIDTLMEDGMEDEYNITNQFPDETKHLVSGSERNTAVESQREEGSQNIALDDSLNNRTYCMPATLSDLYLVKKHSHE